MTYNQLAAIHPDHLQYILSQTARTLAPAVPLEPDAHHWFRAYGAAFHTVPSGCTELWQDAQGLPTTTSTAKNTSNAASDVSRVESASRGDGTFDVDRAIDSFSRCSSYAPPREDLDVHSNPRFDRTILFPVPSTHPGNPGRLNKPISSGSPTTSSEPSRPDYSSGLLVPLIMRREVFAAGMRLPPRPVYQLDIIGSNPIYPKLTYERFQLVTESSQVSRLAFSPIPVGAQSSPSSGKLGSGQNYSSGGFPSPKAYGITSAVHPLIARGSRDRRVIVVGCKTTVNGPLSSILVRNLGSQL